MPEGPEIESEKLHEAIHEELEHEGGSFLKQIAMSTTVLAAVAAIAALQAGATVNEALALKTDATRLQAQASDQWTYYQAKGIKAVVAEASETSWTATGAVPPKQYAEKKKRYEDEQKEISEKAKKLEEERDEKSKEADELLHRHHGFAYAVTLFQVAIALGALAALTRIRLVWYGSMALGLGGLVLFALRMMN
jgi:hypothetical protein